MKLKVSKLWEADRLAQLLQNTRSVCLLLCAYTINEEHEKKNSRKKNRTERTSKSKKKNVYVTEKCSTLNNKQKVVLSMPVHSFVWDDQLCVLERFWHRWHWHGKCWCRKEKRKAIFLWSDNGEGIWRETRKNKNFDETDGLLLIDIKYVFLDRIDARNNSCLHHLLYTLLMCQKRYEDYSSDCYCSISTQTAQSTSSSIGNILSLRKSSIV